MNLWGERTYGVHDPIQNSPVPKARTWSCQAFSPSLGDFFGAFEEADGHGCGGVGGVSVGEQQFVYGWDEQIGCGLV
jgi:hypothetical protein